MMFIDHYVTQSLGHLCHDAGGTRSEMPENMLTPIPCPTSTFQNPNLINGDRPFQLVDEQINPVELLIGLALHARFTAQRGYKFASKRIGQ